MRIDLNGKWQFREYGAGQWFPATVPGCNYTDLMANGLIPDPFYGMNEKEVKWVGDRDWEYLREFEADSSYLKYDIIELVGEAIDTLADISLNGKDILKCDNAHRTWRADVKPYLVKGINQIRILFHSPLKYVAEGQKLHRFPSLGAEVKGVPYIRKNQSHFGWDWGPVLPLSGITRDIYIEGSAKAAVRDIKVTQEHDRNKVQLNVTVAAEIKRPGKYKTILDIKAPNGTLTKHYCELQDGACAFSADIVNPELWESNGMSRRLEQPLYKLEVSVYEEDTLLDVKALTVGLRTIQLNTAPDKWGENFQFIVNGALIFARGADWIPSDSFAARITPEKLEHMIRSVRDANMNMLRVWGGGYYESDAFYDLCDRYGILVWQDFGFACRPYAFDSVEFLVSLRAEVADNIRRLRSRASLALWCGNNEIEAMSALWRYRKDFIRNTGKFFYEILPVWVREFDSVTPYRPGSPSSGEYMKDVNADSRGDTHLWQVWHGLKPYNYYRKRLTRFCSEFGFESLPDFDTVKSFAKDEELDLKSPVMLSHQKCPSGNMKMLYYLAARFRIPKDFSDLVYLTQIVQMECIRDATEHWRRNMQRCSGALFWQLNDCWPVSSWASIDYYGRWKALQYRAKQFNAPEALSIEEDGLKAKVYIANDRAAHYEANVCWKLIDFAGEPLDSGSVSINCAPLAATCAVSMNYKDKLKSGKTRKKAVLAAWIEGAPETLRTVLFVPEKRAELPKAEIISRVKIADGYASITLMSEKFAKFVEVRAAGASDAFSDNFFDLLPGKERTITVKLIEGVNAESLRLSVRSLSDVKPKHPVICDSMLRLYVKLTPANVIMAIGQSLS